MLEKSKAMTDEEFQTMVKSVLVELEAKDKNLSEENSRFWKSEIANHRYMFDRN
jgi:secreted Zn-dependent insulinase-like peptidase